MHNDTASLCNSLNQGSEHGDNDNKRIDWFCRWNVFLL